MVFSPAQLLLHEDGCADIAKRKIGFAFPKDGIEIFLRRMKMINPGDRTVLYPFETLNTQIGVQILEELANF